MKSSQIFLSIFALIGALILYAIWNVGLLMPVTVEQVETPQMSLVYQAHTGPYHEVGKIFESVESALSEKNVKCVQTFGRYHDNPDEVEHERLRSDIGCILEKPLAQPIEGFKTEELSSFKALKGTFEGAPWLTAFKVYSTLRKESYQRNLHVDVSPIFETYSPSPRGFRTQVYFRIADKFQTP